MHVRRLHQLGQALTNDGFLSRFQTNRRTRPVIECLLITDRTDTTLSYLFSVDGTDSLDGLEGILRGLFPSSYELERRAVEPTHVTDHLNPATDQTLGAVTYQGKVERKRDWQTSLTPFSAFLEETTERESHHAPLATIVETMAASEVPMVFQTLIQAKPDWSQAAEERRLALESAQDTLGESLLHSLFGPPDEEMDIPAGDETRIAELDVRETRRSFLLNARLALVTPSAAKAKRLTTELASAFADVSHTTYEITGSASTGTAAQEVTEAIQNRTLKPATYDSLRNSLPGRNKSQGIIVDARELPNFCLLSGETLTTAGSRALSPRPGEQTALPRPPVSQLERYRGDGLLLGNPLTQDGTPDETPLVLPPALQPLHLGWFGKTGSGKSTSLINAMLANHEATEGASILIDPKGDGMATDYMQAHYAQYGSLENVLYFDCAEVLPAFSMFDIRRELEAGISRTTAVEEKVEHYIEMLTQIMGKDRFEQAVRSPDIIRYLTKAMFDPVNGEDAFSHRDLHTAVRQMHERQAAPPVSDADLEGMLAGVVANRARSFDEIMQGVANRMEKIPINPRLAKIFNHVPESEDDPYLDFEDYLSEDTVIIFETGELRSEAQRVLTLVILSNLWTALRRRTNRRVEPRDTDYDEMSWDEKSDYETEYEDESSVETDQRDQPKAGSTDELPLVNLYIEEAASIAVSDLLKELLAQSRSFGCSLTLAMQFPGQMRTYGEDVYDEVLNNISTLMLGNVPADRRLAERLATDESTPQDIANRLRALRRGQWLATLPAGFGKSEPRPFLVESAGLPPGHPEGDQSLSSSAQTALTSAIRTRRERTCEEVGLSLRPPQKVEQEGSSDGEDETEDIETSIRRIDSALPLTNRLPPTVEYLESIHGLGCRECDNRYNPDSAGMKRAIACCSSLAEVDSDDIPICDVNLKLTPEEREASEWSDRQLLFLQAVYNAQQLRYDPLEYDLLSDSMIRIQEYIDIASTRIEDLVDAGLLRHDSDHPHRLYTVPPDGRSVIGESYRLGVDYGHGAGDLEESSQHVMAVEVGRQYLIEEYQENPDSDVTEVIPYYDLDQDQTISAAAFMGSKEEANKQTEEYEQRRLDVAGLSSEGEVVAAVEAERVNHDVKRAVPEDFDKIAECGVEEAIWIVMTQSAGHDVLAALNEPTDGTPRVEKTYAKTTPPQQFRIDSPGLSAMYPVEWLRDQMEES
jgi:hypothetical protein